MIKSLQKFTLIKSFTLILLVLLPFLGSDCNNETTTPGGNIQGTWKLDFVQGNLQDVCQNETVDFPSNTSGTATLTCPGNAAITRAYTYTNNVVTYTETSVQYTVSTSTDGLIILTGVNVGRTLTYRKVTSTQKNPVNNSNNTNSSNSSELNTSN